MTLTEETIEKAKPGINAKGMPTDKPYKLGDALGLFLLIHPNGGKWWRYKYRFAGKENQVSLGTYPEVTLTKAREKRDRLKTLLLDGINPSTQIKIERAERRAEEARQEAATRFMLDSNGALSFRLGSRALVMTPDETTELRIFLDATRAVTPRGSTCP